MKTSRLLLAAALVLFAAPRSGRADFSIDKSDVAAPATTTASKTSTRSSSTTTSPSTTTTEVETGTDTPTAAPESPRIAQLEQRFAHGQAVEAEGRPKEALAIFDGIIKDAPDAKGSLREAGKICVELGDASRADVYFSKLHALVPDYPGAIEALIQVNQALKRDAKVEILIAQYKKLYAAGKVPHPYFVRERIRLDGGTEIVIAQYFDYHQPPNYAWVAELFDAQHNRKRRLSVNYDPEVTATMRKDPKLVSAEQFLVVDNVLTSDAITRLDVYQQFLALPDYHKMRTVLMEIFANALKPIDSAPVPQSTR